MNGSTSKTDKRKIALHGVVSSVLHYSGYAMKLEDLLNEINNKVKGGSLGSVSMEELKDVCREKFLVFEYSAKRKDNGSYLETRWFVYMFK